MGKDGAALGHIFPVVVKVGNRDRPPYRDFQKEWRSSWQAIQNCFMGSKNIQDVIERFDEDDLKSRQGLTIFRQTIFPMLNNSPSDLRSWSQLIYKYGKALGLWLRTNDASVVDITSLEEIYNHLLETKLEELPVRLKEERVNASCIHKNDAGNHLTLLWDDPNHQPKHDHQASSP